MHGQLVVRLIHVVRGSQSPFPFGAAAQVSSSRVHVLPFVSLARARSGAGRHEHPRFSDLIRSGVPVPMRRSPAVIVAIAVLLLAHSVGGSASETERTHEQEAKEKGPWKENPPSPPPCCDIGSFVRLTCGCAGIVDRHD